MIQFIGIAISFLMVWSTLGAILGIILGEVLSGWWPPTWIQWAITFLLGPLVLGHALKDDLQEYHNRQRHE